MVSHDELQARHTNLLNAQSEIRKKMEQLRSEMGQLNKVLNEVDGSIKFVNSLMDLSAKEEKAHAGQYEGPAPEEMVQSGPVV